MLPSRILVHIFASYSPVGLWEGEKEKCIQDVIDQRMHETVGKSDSSSGETRLDSVQTQKKKENYSFLFSKETLDFC